MYKILGADQKEYGPITADQVRQWIAERRLNAQSMARLEGTEGWKPLAEFPEFSRFGFAANASLASAPPVPAPLAPVGGYKPPPATNNMAVTGLIMGCLSVVCCQFLGILGIVFSAIALSQLKSNPGQAGRGMAIAGLILSLLSFIILGLFLAFGVFSSLLQQLSR